MSSEEIKNDMLYFCYDYKDRNGMILHEDYKCMKTEDILKTSLSFIDDIIDRLRVLNHYRSNKDIFALIDYIKDLAKKNHPDLHMNISIKKPLNGDVSSRSGKVFVYIDGEEHELREQFIQFRPITGSDMHEVVYDMSELTAELSRREQITPLTGLNATMYIADEEEARRGRRVTLDDESCWRYMNE